MNGSADVSAPTGAGLAPIGPMLLAQTRAEVLKAFRTPAFSVSTLVLSVVFYAFFGLPNAKSALAGVTGGRFLVASLGAYGVLSVMLFSFGVGVAVERGQRMNVLMRAAPVSPLVFLLARVIAALLFASLSLALLFVFAAVTNAAQMGAAMWLALFFRLLFGALPFVALGFAIGYLTGPNSAAPVTQILFLILSFASGLFVPLPDMPAFIQKIAPYLPTYRYAQLAWDEVGARTGSPGVALLWLVGYGVLFAVIALRAYWREDAKQFG